MNQLHKDAIKHHEYPTGMLYLQIPARLSQAFKELINRGGNLWPDAPPEIKELVDVITNGKVMQDYFAQAGEIRPDYIPFPFPREPQQPD